MILMLTVVKNVSKIVISAILMDIQATVVNAKQVFSILQDLVYVFNAHKIVICVIFKIPVVNATKIMNGIKKKRSVPRRVQVL